MLKVELPGRSKGGRRQRRLVNLVKEDMPLHCWCVVCIKLNEHICMVPGYNIILAMYVM